jgi:fluoride ion exporter CrcB/FEX
MRPPVLWLLAASSTSYLEGSFMDKWQQKFSIGYFFVALILLFLLQTISLRRRPKSIDYSRFKAFVNKGMVADLTLCEKTIRGEIKP